MYKYTFNFIQLAFKNNILRSFTDGRTTSYGVQHEHTKAVLLVSLNLVFKLFCKDHLSWTTVNVHQEIMDTNIHVLCMFDFSRFIINIPEEERQDLIRVFFQIELAHWFYLDFYCQENPELKARGIKDFSSQSMYIQVCVQLLLSTWCSYRLQQHYIMTCYETNCLILCPEIAKI